MGHIQLLNCQRKLFSVKDRLNLMAVLHSESLAHSFQYCPQQIQDLLTLIKNVEQRFIE